MSPAQIGWTWIVELLSYIVDFLISDKEPERSSQKAPVTYIILYLYQKMPRYILTDERGINQNQKFNCKIQSGGCCIEQHNEYENGYKHIRYHLWTSVCTRQPIRSTASRLQSRVISWKLDRLTNVWLVTPKGCSSFIILSHCRIRLDEKND